jgi:hypothetical protein
MQLKVPAYVLLCASAMAWSAAFHAQYAGVHYDLPNAQHGQWGQSILNVDGRYLVLFGQGGLSPDHAIGRGPGVMMLGSEGQMLWWDHWTGGEDYRFTNEMGTLNQVEQDGSVLAGTYRQGFLIDSLFIRRLDHAGNTMWERIYSDEVDRLSGTEAVASSDGHLYVVGGRFGDPPGARRSFLWKLTATGDLVWEVDLEAPLGSAVNTVDPTEDGGCVIGGSTNSNTCNSQAWIARYSADGTAVWTTTFGGPYRDEIRQVHVQADQSVVLGGASGTTCDGWNMDRDWVGRITAEGTLQWRTFLNPAFGHYFRSTYVPDDGTAIYGVGAYLYDQNEYYGLVCRYSMEGDSLWCRAIPYYLNGESGSMGILNAITEGPAGTLTAVGHSTFSGTGISDLWFLRLDGDGTVLDEITLDVSMPEAGGGLAPCHPNPSDGAGVTCRDPWGRTGSWSVIDMAGRVVHREDGVDRMDVGSIGDLRPGAYTVVFTGASGTTMSRLIITR